MVIGGAFSGARSARHLNAQTKKVGVPRKMRRRGAPTRDSRPLAVWRCPGGDASPGGAAAHATARRTSGTRVGPLKSGPGMPTADGAPHRHVRSYKDCGSVHLARQQWAEADYRLVRQRPPACASIILPSQLRSSAGPKTKAVSTNLAFRIS